MRVLGVLGICLGVLAGAAQARAGTTTYYRAGDWRAFSGTDEQNRLLCGMATGNAIDGRNLEISAVIGDPQLGFQASKPTWDIPPDTKIPVVIQAAGTVPWTEEAAGGAHAIRWTLSESEAATFEQAFRDGSEMTISFPSGNEPSWRVLLAGSNAVDRTFRRCIRDYTARAAAAAPQAPTQPFGQPATQPFAPPVGAAPLPPPAGSPVDAAEAPAPAQPTPSR
jgi:hypothetical protein